MNGGGRGFPSGLPEEVLVSITRWEERVILTDDIPQYNASSFTSLLTPAALPLTPHG